MSLRYLSSKKKQINRCRCSYATATSVWLKPYTYEDKWDTIRARRQAWAGRTAWAGLRSDMHKEGRPAQRLTVAVAELYTIAWGRPITAAYCSWYFTSPMKGRPAQRLTVIVYEKPTKQLMALHSLLFCHFNLPSLCSLGKGQYFCSSC